MSPERPSELEEENQRLRSEVDWLRQQIASGSGGDREAWLLGLLENSPDVISVLSPDGKLLYLNRMAGSHLSISDILGKLAADFVPPGDRERWIDALAHAVTTGEPQRVDVVSTNQMHWETRLVPIRRDGHVVAVLSIGTDVTARKEIEQALAASQQNLRLALDASGVGLWRWEIGSNRAVWDAAMYRLLGRPPSEAGLGRDEYLAIVHPDDRPGVAARIQRNIAAGTFEEGEYRIVLPTGEVRWVFVKGEVRRGADGRVTELLGGLVDVTRIKRLEGELHQAAKMEAIGHLAGGVAHDFNNLLLAIMANATLARKNPDDVARMVHLDEIARAAERAATLTKQLLTFGRRHAPDRQRLDVNEAIGEALSLLRRLIPETIEFDFDPGAALPPILADRVQFEQVIVNLCVNARDAMPDGGRIHLAAEGADIDEKQCAEHAWARPGRYVSLTIADTGAGMTAEVKERAFEPFFTTKDVGHGTGLGLSTVYGTLRQHGGLIRLESETGRGTTFKLYFPVDDRPAEPTGRRVAHAAAGGSELVLVAEDQELVRNVVVGLLENAGYRVLWAADGHEALDLLARHGAEVKLVLLDAIMPRMGGLDAAGAIRRSRPDLAVIVSSGYTDEIANGHETPLVGVEFLPKPYEADELLRTVRRLLDRTPQPTAEPVTPSLAEPARG